jgi:hypothetical protein|nr:MAG TPA: hypothetical protein [Caudoviricetes sp.]
MFWKVVLFIAIGYGAFFVGIWGFAQIVGSLQNIKERGAALTISTIVIHIVLLSGIAFVVIRFLPLYKTALFIGYGISLIKILLSGRIR